MKTCSKILGLNRPWDKWGFYIVSEHWTNDPVAGIGVIRIKRMLTKQQAIKLLGFK